jgi:hypothetical protein
LASGHLERSLQEVDVAGAPQAEAVDVCEVAVDLLERAAQLRDWRLRHAELLDLLAQRVCLGALSLHARETPETLALHLGRLLPELDRLLGLAGVLERVSLAREALALLLVGQHLRFDPSDLCGEPLDLVFELLRTLGAQADLLLDPVPPAPERCDLLPIQVLQPARGFAVLALVDVAALVRCIVVVVLEGIDRER